jgi:hypothetical protein
VILLIGFERWLDEPDEQRSHQTFDSPKRRLAKFDERVRNGELPLSEADELRLRIEICAWHALYKYVLNSWNTKDKLAEVFARYQKAVSDEELQRRDVDEDTSRKQALQKFKDIFCDLVTPNQVPF